MDNGQIEIITTTSIKDLANISSATKDNGNVVIGLKGSEKYVQLPFNKKDKYFMNPTDFIRFIKNCESAIRRSPEYSRYIAYLKNTVGLRSCALFHDLNDAMCPIEMHHYIFNLYDIIEIQIAHLFKAGEPINTFTVSYNVLKDHLANIIQVVMLSEMAHKGWHAFQQQKNKDNARFFIPMTACFGDISKFIEKYHEDMTMQHIMKLKTYFKDYETYTDNPPMPSIFSESVTEWANKFKLTPEGANDGNVN